MQLLDGEILRILATVEGEGRTSREIWRRAPRDLRFRFNLARVQAGLMALKDNGWVNSRTQGGPCSRTLYRITCEGHKALPHDTDRSNHGK